MNVDCKRLGRYLVLEVVHCVIDVTVGDVFGLYLVGHNCSQVAFQLRGENNIVGYHQRMIKNHNDDDDNNNKCVCRLSVHGLANIEVVLLLNVITGTLIFLFSLPHIYIV